MSNTVLIIIAGVCYFAACALSYVYGYRRAKENHSMARADLVINEEGMSLGKILHDVREMGYSMITIMRAKDGGDVWIDEYVATCRAKRKQMSFTDNEDPDLTEVFRAYRVERMGKHIAKISLHKTLE